MERNKRRRFAYKLLRTAGFDYLESTKLKDYKLETLKLLCEVKQEELHSKTELDKITAKRMMDVIQRGKS